MAALTLADVEKIKSGTFSRRLRRVMCVHASEGEKEWICTGAVERKEELLVSPEVECESRCAGEITFLSSFLYKMGERSLMFPYLLHGYWPQATRLCI